MDTKLSAIAILLSDLPKKGQSSKMKGSDKRVNNEKLTTNEISASTADLLFSDCNN